MRACRFARSSIIDRIAFDEAADTLRVWFRQAGQYVYYGVPRSLFEAMFEAMCEAGSAGAFFNQEIKGRFRCRRDSARRRFGPKAEPWCDL